MKEHFTRRRVAILAIIIIALIWWLWPSDRMGQVQALQQELANPEITAERRQEIFQQMRTAMNGMSPEQRAQLRNQGQQRFQEQLNRYFQMTPQEKTAYLDQQINREQQMAQQMQNGAAPKGGFGGGPSGGSAAPKGPPSAEDREKGRQRGLDSTSPEFRGQMDQYRKDMAARRQQRGLAASPSRGGR